MGVEVDGLRTRRSNRKIALIAIVIAVLVTSMWAIFMLLINKPSNPLAAYFQTPQQKVDFPLYYPSQLPSYYFIENDSVTISSDTVTFPISRNDGQKIVVTEQSLPPNFDLSKITGTSAEVVELGRVVIGTGFLGYRAVVATNKTLIFVSSSDQITVADFSAIVKSFRPV